MLWWMRRCGGGHGWWLSGMPLCCEETGGEDWGSSGMSFRCRWGQAKLLKQECRDLGKEVRYKSSSRIQHGIK